MKNFEEVMKDVKNLSYGDSLKLKKEIEKMYGALALNKVVIIDKPDRFAMYIDETELHAVTSYNVSHDSEDSLPTVTVTFDAESVDSIKE